MTPRTLVIVAAVVGLMALGAGVAYLANDSDRVALRVTVPPANDDPLEPTAEPTAPPGPVPTAEPTPDATSPQEPSDGERSFDEQIDELIGFVEVARGLEFQRRPFVEAVSEEEFLDRLLGDLEEEREDIDTFEGIYQATGIIDADSDLYESYADLLGFGVVGFYDTETEELVVRSTTLTPYARVVVAHELVHALDDQWFELYRPEYDDADDEIGFGFAALREGNARRIENEYRASLTAEERAEADREELAIGTDVDISSIELGLALLQIVPYEQGEVLVGEILANGGEPALADAFAMPPTTSEQVLHPRSYLIGEGGEPPPPPPADGEVYEQGVVGEVFLSTMFALPLGFGEAREAAAGWGGDWFVAWRDGERDCIRIDVVMDTSGDLDELLATSRSWAATMPDAQAALVDDMVRIDSCV